MFLGYTLIYKLNYVFRFCTEMTFNLPIELNIFRLSCNVPYM